MNIVRYLMAIIPIATWLMNYGLLLYISDGDLGVLQYGVAPDPESLIYQDSKYLRVFGSFLILMTIGSGLIGLGSIVYFFSRPNSSDKWLQISLSAIGVILLLMYRMSDEYQWLAD